MMTNTVSPRVVGQRLAEARKTRGITQEVAAEHLGISRPTFIAIEKGERAAKSTEIIKLAELYGQPVNYFVRVAEPVTDFQPHFRAAMEKVKPAEADQLRQAINDFKMFVENYLLLERRMKAPMRLNYPQQVELNSRVKVVELAEDVANRERQRLGLGDQPIPNIRNLLEAEVGARIFFGRLPRMFAGMFIFVDGLGGCMLINSVHPPEKQRASIAHEYAHLIVDRHTAGIDYLTIAGRKPPNERFAESFAMNFLMPSSSVRFRFNEIVNATGNFQIADLVRLKHFYSVSMEAMALRLESLGLLQVGTWDVIQSKGLSVREAEKQLGLFSQVSPEPAYPERYKFLAVHAYERGELSEKELANFLRCDVWDARQVIREAMLTVEVDAEGHSRSMHADFETSLLADPS
ncbi:helix-turn-helix domain-containing protein [Fimbriiglobus ruber]|uniref:Transcriptional regulator n=1 Tax=Fimbriiglobus ruber TaxID=1908690 RepID=A0A225E050_9BACT|nr:XRE family transcriptional regulator [Fimbriiglobus ruber]OWK43386.1 transcriptional regulator [Fimbriiglobus ruber]